jgi:hypothetical protein
MTELQIMLPPEASQFLQDKVAAGQFQSPGEAVLALIEDARIREAQRRLAGLLQEGVDSGPGVPMNAAYWQNLRAELAIPAKRSLSE